MECVSQCPGLAIFGYRTEKKLLYLPIEYFAESGSEVFLVDNDGKKVGEGIIERILTKPVSYTHLDVYKRQGYVSQKLTMSK